MNFRNLCLFVLFCSFGACTYSPPTISQPTGGGNGGTGGEATMTSSSSGVGSGGSPVGGGGGGGPMPEDWWKPEWSRRVRITFHNAGGEELNDFPVLIRLNKMRIRADLAAPNGADLRFIDDDGQTVLAHEIDGWTPGGDSFVWVNVPTINASDTDHIWLYYGNPNASDEQNAANVWDSFISVYHLSANGGMPVQLNDSTGAHHGQWFNGNIGPTVPGPIHQAINLDGNRFVDISENSVVAANLDDARTAEAWVNTATKQYQAIVYQEGQCVGWYLGTNPTGQYLGSFITDTIAPLCGDGEQNYSVTSTNSLSGWHYLTLVVDRPSLTMSLFIDGKLETVTSIDNIGVADGNGVYRIGSDHDGGLGTLVGSIDEVRVSSLARSPGWIAAQFKSMTDTFVTFGQL